MKAPVNVNYTRIVKTFLFLALVSGSTWPLMTTTNTVNSEDLASRESETGAAAGVPAVASKPTIVVRAGETLNIGANETPEQAQARLAHLRTLPDTAAATGNRPQVPAAQITITTQSTAAIEPKVTATDSDYEKVCDTKYHFVYREILIGTETHTEISAEKIGKAPNETAADVKTSQVILSQKTTLKVALESKEAIDTKLSRLIESTTPDCKKTETAAATKPAETEVASKEDERLARRHARDIEDCLIAPKTFKKLDDSAQMECFQGKLEDISSDSDSPTAAAAEVFRKAKALLDGPMKRLLVSQVTSDDSAIAEEGQAAARETIRSIQILARANRLDQTKTDQLVGKIEGLEVGGALSRDSKARLVEAKELDRELHTAWTQWKRNPGDKASEFEVSLLTSRHRALSSQIAAEQTGSELKQLLDFERAGYVTPTDARTFRSPYDALRTEMVSMLDPRQLNGSDTSPQLAATDARVSDSSSLNPDILAARSALNKDLAPYGIRIPSSPSMLNLGNFGLTNGRFNSQSPLATNQTLFPTMTRSAPAQQVQVPGQQGPTPLFNGLNSAPRIQIPGARN
jgi:hypothetical protein